MLELEGDHRIPLGDCDRRGRRETAAGEPVDSRLQSLLGDHRSLTKAVAGRQIGPTPLP